jgi:multidrug efflux pump subunit AcrA (membrane-fusion protein)
MGASTSKAVKRIWAALVWIVLAGVLAIAYRGYVGPRRNGPQPPTPTTKVPVPPVVPKVVPTDIRPSLFWPGTPEYREGREGDRRKLASLLASEPKYCVTLKGHVSSDGNVADNTRLAEDRARKVKGDLISLGVSPAERIKVQTVFAPDSEGSFSSVSYEVTEGP